MTIAAFAKVFDAEIAFLFVDDKHLLHDEEWMEGMTRKIRKRVKYPKLSGYISKSTTVTKGIEYFIRKFPADMLVMFTHPRHFPENMYHSSMTQIMSHQSQVPLLVLKRADVSISEAR